MLIRVIIFSLRMHFFCILFVRKLQVSWKKNVLPWHNKQDDRNCDVGKNDAHPNLLAQRIQKTEDSEFLFDGFFYHDADAERHKRFTKIDHAFSVRSDSYGSNCYVGFLQIK